MNLAKMPFWRSKTAPNSPMAERPKQARTESVDPVPYLSLVKPAVPVPPKPANPAVPPAIGTAKPQEEQVQPATKEKPLTMKPAKSGTPAEQMAKQVGADLKAGKVLQKKNGLPVVNELSTRDLDAYSSSSNTRQKIMKALVDRGVVQQQGPRKPALVSSEYRGKGVEPNSDREDALAVLRQLKIPNAAQLVDATSGGSGGEWARNAMKLYKGKG